MYAANLTSGPCQGSECQVRRYRPGWWYCEDGLFQCRLPFLASWPSNRLLPRTIREGALFSLHGPWHQELRRTRPLLRLEVIPALRSCMLQPIPICSSHCVQ